MIDEKRIRENLESVSFPRLSGTEGEKKAFNLLKNKIEELNFEPSVQDFKFTSFYPRVYQKVMLISGFWALFILYLNLEFIFTLLNIIIVALIVIPLIIMTRKPEKIKIGKIKTSQNLYLRLPANSSPSKKRTRKKQLSNYDGNLLFMCHIDGKTQKFPILFRIYFFKVYMISFGICMIIIVLKNLIFTQIYLILFILGVFPLTLNICATIIICLNTTSNKSPGAIDNGSGIACVLELLNYYSDINLRPRNFNLLFIFTGCEETGMQGIRHLYNKIDHLDRRKSYMVSFDCIATEIDVITGERGAFFFKNTHDFTANLHMPKRIRFFRSDAYYLADRGFGGFGVLDIASQKYAHSIHDTPEKVDCLLLKKLLEHIVLMLKFVDKSPP